MKRIIPALVLALAVCFTWSCNEKPRQYTIVKNHTDGNQVIEKFVAPNDTVALSQYLDRMSKIVMEAMTDTTGNAAKIESMFVISPEGDTLNTNQKLMNVIAEQIQKSGQNAVPIP